MVKDDCHMLLETDIYSGNSDTEGQAYSDRQITLKESPVEGNILIWMTYYTYTYKVLDNAH